MLSIGQKLTVDQRLQKAVVGIMENKKYMALAGVLMVGERTISDDIDMTACTDGMNEKYGRLFCEKLNDAELRFLILHENYHKLYRHLHTWEHLARDNQQLANMAMDFVINAKLIEDNEDGFATMTGELTKGCYDPKYKGWDTARVFHDLKKNGKGGGSGHTTSGDVLDKHDWDNAKTMTPDEKDQLAREIDQAIRQGAMVAGKMGSGGDRDIDELLRPQVDWRQILREFITETCAGRDYSSWRKPNRRYISMGIYMPSGVSEKVEELVIAVDTSGSIGSRELSVFLSEVKSIAETVKPSAVHILYWDTEVCRAEKYEMHELDNLINSTKPEGGGGTMIECVPQYMADNNVSPQACIILTDGYLGGSWGQWTCPTLWCVLDNKSAKPDVGKVVHVKSDFM